MAWLLPLLAAPAAAQRFELADDGSWRLDGGPAAVSASLFLWHGDWRYAVPQEARREGQACVGWLAAGPGDARVSYRVEARRQGDRLQLVYTFRRTADSDPRRGVFVLLTLPLESVAGRAIRFSHAPAAAADGPFRGAGRGFSVNLSEDRALAVRADRVLSVERRGDQRQAVAINVRLLPEDFPAETDVSVTLEAELTPAESDRLPWELARREPLAIRSAVPLEPVVPQNTPATIEIDLAATYDNPFNPDDVAVDAEILEPGGRVYSLPGYFHQEYRATWTDGVELLSPAGPPVWRVRFTPQVVGLHDVTVRARDRTGDTGATRVRIDAVAGNAPGVIGLGGNGLHFRRSTGEGLFLIGHNVPTYLAGGQSMVDALDKMAAGGENYTRPWMYSAHLGLEWDQPVGTYRLHEAWRLDHLFELARQRGINLLLCFDTHQDFLDRLAQNPYHVDQGGPIRTAIEFFTDARAKQLYRQRLRYIVARWSWATNLVAWEFVNEIEGWTGYAQNQEAVAAWHSEMAEHLKLLDPYDHPVTTSCWTTAGHPSLWNAPGIDFIQAHHYSNAKVDMALRTADIVRQLRRDYPGRLLLFGEMGIHYQFGRGRGDDEDPTGVHLHKQSWAALMEGAASVPANWWHESYFEPHQLYGVFRGIRRLADAVDFSRPWRPLGDLPAAWVTPPQPLTFRDLEFQGRADSWAAPPEEIRVTPTQDGEVTGSERLPTLLHGRGHADLRRPFVFALDMPADGTLEVTVGRCSNNPRLVARVDGATVLDRPFPTGEGHGREARFLAQWNLWESVYDEVIKIPVPAGRHELHLENTGADWMELTAYRLLGYASNARPPAAVTGLADGRDLLLWVRNTAHWWLPVARGDALDPLAPLRLAVPAAAGRYRLEQWNTVSGEIEARRELTVEGDIARFDTPPVATDVAFRLVREE